MSLFDEGDKTNFFPGQILKLGKDFSDFFFLFGKIGHRRRARLKLKLLRRSY
jgi:hypothetical protein